jgi:hypothetical protein
LNEADLRAALLRVAIGHGGPVVPDADTWEEWASLARLERVVPLLYELVDTVPTDLTDEQRIRIHARQTDAQSHAVRLEHHLVAVSTMLEADGVRSAVLKGPATAHLDYPDPSWREFADVDLLIEPDQRADATAALVAAGWSQRYALPEGHEEFTHALTFVHEAGIELDLHQRIAHRGLGVLVPTRTLLDAAVPLEIGGAQLHALGQVDRMIHAAIHAVTSRGLNRRLSSVADVLRVATATADRARDVLARAERWRVRPLVERAVRDAFATAALPVERGWAAAMRAPTRHRDRLVEQAYLGAHRRPVTEELAYLRLLPGWSPRWRYVRGYFSVGPEYAAQHGRRGFTAQARYALSRLRSRD